MLTDGRVIQRALSDVVDITSAGANAENVASVLNTLDPSATGKWIAGAINVGDGSPQAAFNALTEIGSWGAELKINGAGI